MRPIEILLIMVLLSVALFPGRRSFGQSVDAATTLLARLEAAETRIGELESAASDWSTGYAGGFLIRPVDSQRNPFELRINGRTQFRHTGFARDVTEWTDNAGIVRPVTNRNDFEIERGRLEFRGFLLDPSLQFFFNLDSDTDDGHRVIFHDFWFNYKFNDAFDLYVGKAFVPGSRDWLNGALRTRFADRSMATTFFRPDRSLGVWAIGEPVEDIFYRFMVGNGFNTTDLTPAEIDTQFVYSGSMWVNLGDYGEGYSDLESVDAPAAQVGHSFTFANGGAQESNGRSLAEDNFVRLSNGTLLTQLGALAPGVTVDNFDIYLYSVDVAFKYQGLSANGEYFFRWLNSISGDGPLPTGSFYDHGFYAEAGYFLIPKRMEIISRMSHVFGPAGEGQEFAGGINWFINGTHNWKLTFDVSKLNNTPVSNSGPNLRAGDDGLLFRTQLQVAF